MRRRNCNEIKPAAQQSLRCDTSRTGNPRGNPHGQLLAPQIVMAGVGDFKELVAWQLANELRVVAFAISKKPGVSNHRRYCEQLTDAASSGPRNIAEGFGRYRHKEFAQFVRVAKASESELLDLFVEARQRGFLNDKECGEYEFLARRAIAAATGLIRFLENSADR